MERNNELEQLKQQEIQLRAALRQMKIEVDNANITAKASAMEAKQVAEEANEAAKKNMEAAITEADAKMKKSCENARTKAKKAKQEAIDRVNQVAKEWWQKEKDAERKSLADQKQAQSVMRAQLETEIKYSSARLRYNEIQTDILNEAAAPVPHVLDDAMDTSL
ncbi:hypothetical protein Pcac1_g25870 [Phytophthora cactorum]|nr:hypothetical protein Pcac1_g25870 [Phytophthora cactorum]KAG3147776.1 hypothetical protein PC128_g23717 [Phytophthora cactorum]KAG3187621.1 hypothetical protein C6341_g3156 [Phytophthora cactorum]